MKKKDIEQTKWKGISLLQLLGLIAVGGILATIFCILIF